MRSEGAEGIEHQSIRFLTVHTNSIWRDASRKGGEMATKEPKSRCLLAGCPGFVYSNGAWCLTCAEVFGAKGIQAAHSGHARGLTQDEFRREIENDPLTPSELDSYLGYLSELAAVRGDPDPVLAIRARLAQSGAE
jgi:hypothetical protein